MSVLTSVGILLFSMLILACLHFVPNTFALTYHALAGKFSKYKTSHIALFFILGAETAFAFIFLFIYFIINSSYRLIATINHDLFSWISAGIFVAFSILFYFVYFQKGTGAKLFVSRDFANRHQSNITKIKKRGDVFLLGVTSIIPELIFSLPLFIALTFSVMSLGSSGMERALLILLIILVSILPLLIIYISFNKNINLADYIKFRFKNKTFFRFLISLSYFSIAISIILGVILWKT